MSCVDCFASSRVYTPPNRWTFSRSPPLLCSKAACQKENNAHRMKLAHRHQHFNWLLGAESTATYPSLHQPPSGPLPVPRPSSPRSTDRTMQHCCSVQKDSTIPCQKERCPLIPSLDGTRRPAGRRGSTRLGSTRQQQHALSGERPSCNTSSQPTPRHPFRPSMAPPCRPRPPRHTYLATLLKAACRHSRPSTTSKSC